MAWQARLAQDITASQDNKLQVTVDYFDDVDSGTILHSRTWSLPANTTVAQLQAEVIREGQAARAATNGAAAARVSVPVNTTIAIP